VWGGNVTLTNGVRKELLKEKKGWGESILRDRGGGGWEGFRNR